MYICCNMEWMTIILLSIVFSFLLWYSSRRPKNFPPGVRRIPIIGQVVKGAKPNFEFWKSQNVVGSFLGNYPSVSIQNFHMAKELLNRDEWCGRGISIITRYLRSDNGVNKVTTELIFPYYVAFQL